MKKEENRALYALKAVAATLIILCHVEIPGEVWQIIITLARTGVAMFFFFSGYYMYSENREKYRERAIRKTGRILKIAMASYLFYLVWGILLRFAGTGINSVLEWLYSFISIEPWIWAIFFQADIIAGHLWFLNALAVCYFITYIFRERMFSTISAVIASVLLCIHLTAMNLMPTIIGKSLDMRLCRNAWFYGLPVYILGGCLHKFLNIRKKKYDNCMLLAWGVASLLVLFMEWYFFGYCQLYLGNLGLSLAAFIWVIQNPDKYYSESLVFIGKHLSLYMYVIQWSAINAAAAILIIIHRTENAYLLVLLSVLGTYVASWFLYKMERRNRN